MTRRTLLVALSLMLGALALGGACAVPPATIDDGTGPGGKADGAREDEPPASQVEVKVTIAAEAIEDALWSFDLDRDDAERREVTFYDTPSLELFAAGIVLRARKVTDGPDDSTVKIRPLLASAAWDLDPALFGEDEFKCEIDRTETRDVSSCSLGAEQDTGEIEAVADGERDVDQLFSRAQEDFLALFAPDFDLDDARPLGPVETWKWEFEVDGLPAELTVELWAMPDGESLLELSMKVDADAADDAMAALVALLEELALPLDATQETKTRRVLAFFADAA